jgi:hypothetical protein
MEGQVAVLARRDTGVKETVAWADVATRVPALLEEIYVSALYIITSITHHPSRESYTIWHIS